MKTVFVDVDTQLDFLYPAGALYVPGAEHIVTAVERLNRYAAANGIPVVSTTDAHEEDDPEFQVWPPHCIAGTLGQHKEAATLLDRRIVVPNRETPVALDAVQQIIVEKQSTDVFQARGLRRVLEALDADRYVVYGVVTEVCVISAVRGLLALNRPVTVVEDAIKELRAEDARRTLEEIRSSGGAITNLSETCVG